MIIKLLTLAMVALLVGCGSSAGDGGSNGGGSGSSAGGSGSSNGTTSDSAELIELKKVVEADYEIFISLNISAEGHNGYTDYLKKTIIIKTNQSFTSDDINCKSFNFTKISDGLNDKIKEITYKSKVESQSNKCMESDFIDEPQVKGDKKYIIIGKKK